MGRTGAVRLKPDELEIQQAPSSSPFDVDSYELDNRALTFLSDAVLDSSVTYRHTQRAPLCLLLYAVAAGIFAFGVILADEPAVPLVMSVVGVIMLVLAGSFHHLRVEDEGDELGIRFGPLPLFAKTIRYEDITAIEDGRTTWRDGWGIHISLKGGWVWNLWGFDCVVIHHRGTTRVGTDDPEGLAKFLGQRTGQLSPDRDRS